MLVLIVFDLAARGLLTLALANERCPSGTHWVHAHHRRSYLRADGILVSATNIKGHCRKSPVGYDFWLDRLKPGEPALWPNKKETSKKWSVEEKERTLEALSELPPIFWISSLEGIYRKQQSEELRQNPAAQFEETIVLYDNAFRNFKLSRVIAHEISHILYEKLSVAEKQDYQRAASWMEVEVLEKKLLVRDPRKRTLDSFVQKDGLDSVREDFANNIEFFLFESETLKRLTPKVFEWIRTRYGDSMRLGVGGNP